MKTSRLALILLTAVLASGTAAAQTLLFEEASGQGFPRVLGSIGSGEPVSLLDPDRESSSWFFLIDGQLNSPAQDGWIVQKTGGDGYTEYRMDSRILQFVWRITVSGDGRYARVECTMTNNSSDTAVVQPLLLADTWLGEDNGLPFELDDGSFVRSEFEFSRQSVPGWIRTSRNSTTPDLVVFLNGRIPTQPESVVLGNWLRLWESMAGVQVVEGRSFDYLPFSENDSAIRIAYSEARLSGGESASFTILFGLDEQQPSAGDFDSAAKVRVDVEVENRRLQEYTIGNRLEEISSLLNQIDDILEFGTGPGSPGMNELEQLVEEQERLQKEYENL